MPQISKWPLGRKQQAVWFFVSVLLILDQLPSSGVLIHFVLLLQQLSPIFKNVNFVTDNIFFLAIAAGVLGCCHLLHFIWQWKSLWGRFLWFSPVLFDLWLCLLNNSFFKNWISFPLLFTWISQLHFLYVLWQFCKLLSFGHEHVFRLLSLLLSLWAL